MNSGIGGVDINSGDFYGGIADQCGGLMPGATLGFGETLKAFFSAVDDAIVYIMG